ncbi:MAG: ABC transporter ATP-binding protein [Clostridia bacterium]|nr:ABC transporter ATP-binding protein [Clostridia bacterium]
MKEKENRHLLKKFVKYYKPHKVTFAIDMICSFFFSVVGLLYPMITEKILDEYIPNGMIKEILILSSVLLAVYFIRAGLNYYINYYGHEMGVKMQATMRSDLFRHLEKLPYSFYDNTETGQLMSRMTNDLFNVSELAHHGPENLFITSFMTLSAFVYLCTISWKLALIIFAFLPVLIVIAVFSRKNMTKAFQKSREEIGNINSCLENSIAGIRVTKAYVNAEHEQQRFENNNLAFVRARTKAYKAMGVFHSSMTLVTSIYNVIVLIAGGLFCIYDSANFDYVDLVAFMLSINLFISPIQTLIGFFEQLQDGITGFKRFDDIMITPVEEDAPDAVDIENFNGEIAFENVTFGYDERTVIDNISFTVPKGKTFAFVGASGGGKTTLCHLIPKFYNFESGDITIDGVSIKNITNRSLRQNIGIVQQDVFLFTGTFRDNILYGNPEASEEAIIEAAKKANIHDYIMSLEKGYDTEIGERGVKLSGGQKQRLSIARVFLKNPSILILDEATSALDNTTETLIQQALAELCVGRTTLVVAHRLSTVRKADQILVINKGKIEECGTHDELVEKNGIYKNLYDSQYRDIVLDPVIDCN